MIRVLVLANAEFGHDRQDSEPEVLPDVVEVLEVSHRVTEELNRSPLFEARRVLVQTMGEIREVLDQEAPDLVFHLVESLQCQQVYESFTASLLEHRGIPFTGSGSQALRGCLDKAWTTFWLSRNGIPVPRSLRVDAARLDRDPGLLDHFPLPAIVKPCRTDGSVGIDQGAVVRTSRQALEDRVRLVLDRHGGQALVQEFLEGREFRVACLGNRPVQTMPVNELVFDLPEGYERVYDYDSKWREGTPSFEGTWREVPRLPHRLQHRLESLARTSFERMGMRDYGTVEFRMDAAGTPRVIDINANCDLGEVAWFSRTCRLRGIAHGDLVRAIASMAVARGTLRTCTREASLEQGADPTGLEEAWALATG
ncbi:MAG TPA: ATP-grasp domain-containing protein [Myxococcota bacterium]|nr:ATP-grasp domain-containing protein [Myxococcota bacterium]HQK52532.1 ATP-grasp domain-containing protein [Myxococcota bacterium]